MSPSQHRGLKARAPKPFLLSRASPFPLSFSRPLGVSSGFGVPPPCSGGRAEEGVAPFAQGSCSCRAMRGGDISTYEKAPTGAFFAWSVSPVSGRFLEEESSEPPTGLKATYPVSPSDCLSPGARHLRLVLCERLLPLPGTPVLESLSREYSRLRVCSKLSWLVCDAEDSLEFYPAQAS
ncbi:hypothetical protein Taro_022257 [Colocasia esculenta]|uniref:Uncharacterized protein n=1 Tax=Colocasia esculenta TaxID=4460 RepID=A0A843V4V3_COLES|nr:hypothetical protein [Colocasia esculenta]